MKFLAGLLIGALLSSFFFYKKPEPPKTSEEVISKFRDLSENEGRNYAEAKNAEEKLKAADALYEKMMMLFLAELALNMRPIHKVDPAMIDQVIPKEETLAESSNSSQVFPPTQMAEINKKLTPSLKSLQEYKESSLVTKLDRRSRKVIGTFEGTLHHTYGAHKGRVDRVSVTLDFTQTKNNEIDGTASVILSDPDGYEYSQASGKGGNSSLRIHPTQNDLVFIDASPTSFMSLNTSNLRGTFTDKGETIGTIILRRK
jgi:hypothetical protein